MIALRQYNISSDQNDLIHLFLNDIPLIDVRAPGEFNRGSFPTATNLPLLNDEERHNVGIAYKEKGQEAAVRLGHVLVSGDVKTQRLEQWLKFARQHPEGYLFCFRGGMRSHIVREWMTDARMPYPLIKGGYKTLRRFLIETFDHLVTTRKFFVISGRTGIGKTTVIHQLPNAIDLEALANHRGSSFGRHLTAQPSQIDFENALAIKLLKICHASEKPVFIEDEAHIVGRCALPLNLLAGIKTWPTIILEETLENRISNVQKDYVTDMLAQYQATYGADGFMQFSTFLKGSLFRIRKRLGGAQYKELVSLMDSALAVHQELQDESLHRIWIRELLVKYYDPMYDYQLSRRDGHIVFKGTRAEILEWCQHA